MKIISRLEVFSYHDETEKTSFDDYLNIIKEYDLYDLKMEFDESTDDNSYKNDLFIALKNYQNNDNIKINDAVRIILPSIKLFIDNQLIDVSAFFSVFKDGYSIVTTQYSYNDILDKDFENILLDENLMGLLDEESSLTHLEFKYRYSSIEQMYTKAIKNIMKKNNDLTCLNLNFSIVEEITDNQNHQNHLYIKNNYGKTEHTIVNDKMMNYYKVDIDDYRYSCIINIYMIIENILIAKNYLFKDIMLIQKFKINNINEKSLIKLEEIYNSALSIEYIDNLNLLNYKMVSYLKEKLLLNHLKDDLAKIFDDKYRLINLSFDIQKYEDKRFLKKSFNVLMKKYYSILYLIQFIIMINSILLINILINYIDFTVINILIDKDNIRVLCTLVILFIYCLILIFNLLKRKQK